MEDCCPYCGAEIDKDALGWVRFSCNTIRYKPVAGFPGSYSSGITCHKRQIANLTARLDETTRLLRYQEERNHSLNERLNEAEDRLERLLGEL